VGGIFGGHHALAPCEAGLCGREHETTVAKKRPENLRPPLTSGRECEAAGRGWRVNGPSRKARRGIRTTRGQTNLGAAMSAGRRGKCRSVVSNLPCRFALMAAGGAKQFVCLPAWEGDGVQRSGMESLHWPGVRRQCGKQAGCGDLNCRKDKFPLQAKGGALRSKARLQGHAHVL